MKILGINKEFKNEELPSFSKLKKDTYDYFIRKPESAKRDIQELVKQAEVPISGFIDTYFGVNYDKGGLDTIFKKGIFSEEEDNEGVWGGSMKLKIEFSNNFTHCISLHCSHCNSIFDLQSNCLADGIYDYVLKKRSGEKVEYRLSLIFLPDLDLENKICTDDIAWNFFTGIMYWRDKPYYNEEYDREKSDPRRNYFLERKFDF